MINCNEAINARYSVANATARKSLVGLVLGDIVKDVDTGNEYQLIDPENATNDNGWSSVPAAQKLQNKTANFTAVSFGRYQTVGTVVVTDPVTAVTNDSYMVRIASGTATVGGVIYSPSRFDIVRYYNGSVWATQTAVITGGLTVDGEAFAPIAGDVTLTDPLTSLKLVVRGQMLIADSTWVFPTAAAVTPTLTDNGNNQLANYAGNAFVYLTVASSSTANNTDCYLPATWPVGVPLVAYLNSTGATKGNIRVYGSATETTILASTNTTLTVAFVKSGAGWQAMSGVARVVAGGLAGTIGGGINGTISGGANGSITGGTGGTISGGSFNTIIGGFQNTISAATYTSILGGVSNTISGGAGVIIMGGDTGLISSGTSATLSGGLYGAARINYEQCFGMGRYAASAYHQERRFGFGVSTSSTDPTDLLYFIFGTATACVLPAEATWTAEVLVYGRQDAGYSGMAKYLIQAERTGNTTRIISIVNTVSWIGDTLNIGTPTWTISTDDTSDCLKINVKPANTTATRWGAKVTVCEAMY